MNQTFDFSKGSWDTDALGYAYSYRFEETPVFVRREGCIENQKNDAATYGFDNISLLTREKYGPGMTVTTRCAFEDLGAPLIVLTPQITQDPRGVNRYGDYIEVVLWKNGVNVWRMWMEKGAVTWKQLLGVDFPVSETDIHTLSVTTGTDTLQITADDQKILLHVENLYPAYHVGINACEGINRFYALEVDGE